MERQKLLADIFEKDKDFVLSCALGEIENVLYTNPKLQGLDELTAIREDLSRMTDYWMQGYPDDNRQKIYDQLAARTQRLICNVERQAACFKNVRDERELREQTAIFDKLKDPETLRQKLEYFVTELAMVDLLPADKRETRRSELLKEKFEFLEMRYDAIMLSPQWSEEEALNMEELFLSPLIDSFSQQALIPAVILSCCMWFDFRKERMLINVYMKSTDVQVRQRALVGLAIAMDSTQYRIADAEHEDPIGRLLEDGRTVKELRDLQLQLAMAQLAESDKDVMDTQIIPNIVNNSPLAFKNGAFEEVDDDEMEDIMDPDAADRRRETLENTVNFMQKLYKNGRDIYYGSFRNLKRFPFFDKTINWTMPYTRLHPSIVEGLDSRVGRILAVSAEHSQLCDSDSYSFLLSLKRSMPQMPEAMIRTLDEMTNMPEADPSQMKPAMIRRNLIQNIYRLTHLMKNRLMFPDLFEDVETAEGIPGYLFFAQPVFADTELVRKWGAPVAMVLHSRDKFEDAFCIMENYGNMEHTFESACLMAELKPDETDRYLEEALTFRQDKEVLSRLAVYYTRYSGDDPEKWERGMEIFNKLLEQTPDDIEVLKDKCYALLRMPGREEEAKALFYRAHYEDPEDLDICRALGNMLLNMGNAEQACVMLEKVFQECDEDPDRITYGMGLLACRRFQDALEVLELVDYQLPTLAIDDRRPVLTKCGVTPLEIKMFKSLLAGMD